MPSSQFFFAQFIIQAFLFAMLLSAFMVGAYVSGDIVHHLVAIGINSTLIMFCLCGMVVEAVGH